MQPGLHDPEVKYPRPNFGIGMETGSGAHIFQIFISSFYDIFSTFADLVDVENKYPTYGLRMLPALLDNGPQEEHDYLYWEFPEYNGQQAVRIGKWKGVRQNLKEGDIEIQLFDLETDPGELVNLADDFPNIIDSISQIMNKAHQRAIFDRFLIPVIDDQAVE